MRSCDSSGGVGEIDRRFVADRSCIQRRSWMSGRDNGGLPWMEQVIIAGCGEGILQPVGGGSVEEMKFVRTGLIDGHRVVSSMSGLARIEMPVGSRARSRRAAFMTRSGLEQRPGHASQDQWSPDFTEHQPQLLPAPTELGAGESNRHRSPPGEPRGIRLEPTAPYRH